VIGRVPYARAGTGLASAFMGARLPLWVMVPAVAVATALAGTWALPQGPLAVLAALAAFAAVVVLGVRRLGGFTGDVLGAAGMMAETVGLLVAAAHR
jgi:adenosylcobinamide-GDP ribazoletransferase